MLVNEIVSKIRFKAADEECVQYTDEHILQVINEAHRFIMSIYVDEYPDILADEQIGTLEAGNNSIRLERAPLKIVIVRINGKMLHFANLKNIEDTMRVGEPKLYTIRKEYLSVYPIPEYDCTYNVNVVYENNELHYGDELPYPTDFTDYLVEFAVMRLQTVDGASVSMEANIFGELRSVVQKHIKKLAPDTCVVESYY